MSSLFDNVDLDSSGIVVLIQPVPVIKRGLRGLSLDGIPALDRSERTPLRSGHVVQHMSNKDLHSMPDTSRYINFTCTH